MAACILHMTTNFSVLFCNLRKCSPGAVVTPLNFPEYECRITLAPDSTLECGCFLLTVAVALAHQAKKLHPTKKLPSSFFRRVNIA